MKDAPQGFSYRALLGWVSEFVSRPLPGVWPQTALDDATVADLRRTFEIAADSGYTHMTLWGLFVDRRWPVDLASCCDADRRARIQNLVRDAHAHGLRVLCGVGLYSWGFDAILEAHPRLRRGEPMVMCPSEPESHVWMERVLDFLMDGFGFDGLNLQSSDQGRCPCDECGPLSDIEYHARLYRHAARHVRSRRPDAFLVSDHWCGPMSGPDDIAPLADLSADLDAMIDTDDSAGRLGLRRTLTNACRCPVGTLAGRSVWPPQWWGHERWFLLTTLVNVPTIRALSADGARAAEQFIVTAANPSGEVTLRFMGNLLADPSADPERLLRDAVAATYRPRTEDALDRLTQAVRTTEEAYFANANRPHMPEVGLFFVDGGFLCDTPVKPATYLQDMTPEGRRAYAAAIRGLLPALAAVRTDVDRPEKIDLTIRCLEHVLEDAGRAVSFA